MLTVQILTVLLFVPVKMVIKEAGSLVPLPISVAMIHHVLQTQIALIRRIWQFASVRLDLKVI